MHDGELIIGWILIAPNPDGWLLTDLNSGKTLGFASSKRLAIRAASKKVERSR